MMKYCPNINLAHKINHYANETIQLFSNDEHFA